MARLTVRLPLVRTNLISTEDAVIVPGSPEVTRGEDVTVYFDNTKSSFEACIGKIKVVPANGLPSYVLTSWGTEGEPVSEFIGRHYGISGLPENMPVTIYYLVRYADK